jgi:hypothetical protein
MGDLPSLIQNMGHALSRAVGTAPRWEPEPPWWEPRLWNVWRRRRGRPPDPCRGGTFDTTMLMVYPEDAEQSQMLCQRIDGFPVLPAAGQRTGDAVRTAASWLRARASTLMNAAAFLALWECDRAGRSEARRSHSVGACRHRAARLRPRPFVRMSPSRQLGDNA